MLIRVDRVIRDITITRDTATSGFRGFLNAHE